MTLGEKIKKYRKLNGMTQKELGMKVGFSEETAGSRIVKYESNIMAPKDGIRKKLADALNVDLSALSDNDIQNHEDVMQVLFLFESVFGMDIEKKDGKTYLIFDDNNKDIRTLITYLNIWKSIKKFFLKNPPAATEENIKKYEIWKSRFTGNVEEYFESKLNSINEHYALRVSDADSLCTYAEINSDINSLIQKIMKSGMSVTTTYIDDSASPGESGYTFIVDELLSPPSEESEKLFAKFLYEINQLAEIGSGYYTEFQMIDKKVTVTYVILSRKKTED